MSDFPMSLPAAPRRRSLLTLPAEELSPGREDKALQRSREKLAEYDDHLLNDIGITREQALGQAARSAWGPVDWLTWSRTR